MGFLGKKNGNWMFRYYAKRARDGKTVERGKTIGPITKFPSEKKAWAEVARKKLHLLEGVVPTTFAELAEHFKTHELDKSAKAKSTIYRDKHSLDAYVLPRWGKFSPLAIKPLEVEDWLRSIPDLSNPTLVKIKTVMGQVYKHAQRHDLLPRDEGINPMLFVRCATTSDYEPVALTPEETFRLLQQLEKPEYPIALLIACTGLRQSEAFGLRWADLNFEKNVIRVRRTWRLAEVGKGKTKLSMSEEPMHPILADAMQDWRRETLYHRNGDWVFASNKCSGKVPRCGSIAVRNYLKPAAVAAGILTREEITDAAGNVTGIVYRNSKGEVVQKFGWHSLRHGLSSFLVSNGTDPKTVQSLLRHSNVKTTLELYAHANSDNKMAAQGAYIDALTAAKRERTEQTL